MYVAHKAVPDVMDIGNKAWERRSIFSSHMAAHKGFLNKDDMWVVATYVSLEGSKLWEGLNSTGVPGDDMKLHPASEICLFLYGWLLGTMMSRQCRTMTSMRCCFEECIVVAPWDAGH